MKLKVTAEKIIKKMSMRVRLILLVTSELVVCVLLAVGISELLGRFVFPNFEVPIVLYLLGIGLFVGILATNLLGRYFLDPIKKLLGAMEQVGEGDFSVRLTHKKTAPREIQELYSGFNLMTQELNATEILQTDFVSNVSHEFKTPINAIEGYAMLLQGSENMDPEQQEYVEKIVFNTKRLSDLTGSILLLSKLENQAISTNQSSFSLDEQIRQSIVALEAQWEKKDIELDVELEPLEYFGSEKLLRHVWDNLISNAIKFSHPGGVIVVRLKKQDGRILFSVEDHGVGISQEIQGHIFGKFYQADNSHKQEGNGLGLALVDKILKLENGRIQVESHLGQGSTFTVSLSSKI